MGDTTNEKKLVKSQNNSLFENINLKVFCYSSTNQNKKQKHQRTETGHSKRQHQVSKHCN
jgi:hypothetical protein